MLEEFRSTSITWDKATRRIYSPITANASDENGRKLVVQIVNGGQVEDLTGATLHLYWETRDKAHDGLDVFKAVDLEKGEFELSYTTGMLSNQGVLNTNLVLIDTVGRVVSERFKITVTEGIDNDAIQSENSFSSLTQALIDVSNLEQNYAPRLNDLTAQLQQTEQSLNAQLAHKAEQDDLVVERARIDSLASLSEGSTTGDAELIDARVGADGITYDNAGGAIRNQFYKINNDLAAHKLDYDEQATIPLKNVVVNGDFSNGIVGWEKFYSVNTVNEGILNNTGDGTNAIPRTYSMAYNRTGGHKYYVKVRWRVTNSQCTKLYITGFGANHEINVPVENVWYDTKAILTPTTSSASAVVQLNHSYSDTTIANGKVMQIENVLAIDLTETFGVGKEPTESEMDIILSKYPNGWFDGTVNISTLKELYDELRDKTIQLNVIDNKIKTMLVVSSNLINSKTFLPNKNINVSGQIIDSTYTLSDYIPIKPNTVYSGASIQFRSYFDMNKQFISRNDVFLEAGQFTTPMNAYFIRVTTSPQFVGVSCRLNEGDELLSYVDYGEFINPDLLNKSDNNKQKYYFMPEEINGVYKLPESNYTRNDNVLNYHLGFSDLVTTYPDYITSTLLGYDESGEHPIYQYSLKPNGVVMANVSKKLPKILLACGLHGSEKNSVMSVYHLIKDICERWTDNPLLEYLRWNVEIITIPLANPYGYSHPELPFYGRENYNGVDMNRNFEKGWIQGVSGENTYGGEYAFSEKETQYIRDMINSNTDAIYFGDYHTNGSSGANYNDLMWFSHVTTPYLNDNIQIASKYTIEKMTRELIKDYSLPNNEGMFGYMSYSNIGGSAKLYAADKTIPSSTIECWQKFPTESIYSSSDTIKGCTEYLGNWLLSVLKQFKKSY